MEKEEAQGLLPYAVNDRQVQALEAVLKTNDMNEAAKLYGTNARSHRGTLTRIKRSAAKQGYAFEHFTAGVAEGYKMGKVTVHRKNGQIQQTWERQHPDAEVLQKVIERIDESAKAFKAKALPPIKKTHKSNKDLLTLYTITDFHFGMYAWGEESGEDWDVKIAQTVLKNAIDDMVNGSPPSEMAILNQLGDFMHWDGLESVTPQNKHILDADTRFDYMVDLSIQMMQYAVERLLEKHNKVKVIMCEGNHDLAGSVWLRKTMKYLFFRNKRVEVDDTSFPYYAHLHGDILIGLHHGHKINDNKLPALFASEPRYRAMWGQALYAYIHTGHKHSKFAFEDGGAIVERHPTLSARDAYCARGGYMSSRAANAITYHAKTGEHSRAVVHPDYKKR